VAVNGLRALLGALLVAVAAGCGGSCGSPASGSSASGPSGSKPLRCRDFLEAAELRALGLDASRFDPELIQSDPVLGVRCELGKVSVTVFDGAQYAPMLSDLHAAVASKQIVSHPGPRFGSDTQWTLMGELHGLLFLSSSKRYAASLAGRDQALMERLAARLDARMN
jgi:hypothetical protein